MSSHQAAPDVRYSRGKAVLCLDVDFGDLQRIRRALRAAGISGGHFTNPWHNGRSYRYGNYLDVIGRGPATPADRDHILAIVRQELDELRPAASPAPPASSASPVPTRQGGLPAPQGIPVWRADIQAWQRDVAQVFSAYPPQRRAERRMAFDANLLTQRISSGDFRGAQRLLATYQREEIAPAALAPFLLRLAVAQRHWEDAIALAREYAAALADAESAFQLAEALLALGNPDEAVALLGDEPPALAATAQDVARLELLARGYWAQGRRVEGLRALTRLLQPDALSLGSADEQRRRVRLKDQLVTAGWLQIAQDPPQGTAESLVSLIDALLPFVEPDELAQLQERRALLTAPVAPPIAVAIPRSPLDSVRDELFARRYDAALRQLDLLPPEVQRAERIRLDCLRAEALAGLGRDAESAALDRRLLDEAGDALAPADRRRLFERLLVALARVEDYAAVAAIADRVAGEAPEILARPEIVRAVALGRWDTGDANLRDEARPNLLAILRADPDDLPIARRLHADGIARLSDEEAIVVFDAIARANPQDDGLAVQLSERLYQSELPQAIERAYQVMCRYLDAVDRQRPTARVCELARWTLDLAAEGAREDELPVLAIRVVQLHARADEFAPLLGHYFDDCLRLCREDGDRLALLEQFEMASAPVRERAAGVCAEFLHQELRRQSPRHLRQAVLLLDSLDPERLRALIPDVAQGRAVAQPEPGIDLRDQTICLIGGTAATRRRAFDVLARDYGLPKDGRREVEPFDERFDGALMRQRVSLQKANGTVPVDLVIHVPDQESHEVFYALQAARSGFDARGDALEVREAAGAGSTSLIRAVEEFYRERTGESDE